MLLSARLPKPLPFMGFYSFGEIGPLATCRVAVLHNCTMITLHLRDVKCNEATVATITLPQGSQAGTVAVNPAGTLAAAVPP